MVRTTFKHLRGLYRLMRINRLKIILKVGIRIVSVIVIILFTIILLRAFDTRKYQDLEVWHTQKLIGEFNSSMYDPKMRLDDYLEIENKLFDQISDKVLIKNAPASSKAAII